MPPVQEQLPTYHGTTAEILTANNDLRGISPILVPEGVDFRNPIAENEANLRADAYKKNVCPLPTDPKSSNGSNGQG